MKRSPPFLSHGVAEGVGVNVFSTPVGESLLQTISWNPSSKQLLQKLPELKLWNISASPKSTSPLQFRQTAEMTESPLYAPPVPPPCEGFSTTASRLQDRGHPQEFLIAQMSHPLGSQEPYIAQQSSFLPLGFCPLFYKRASISCTFLSCWCAVGQSLNIKQQTLDWQLYN